MVDIRPSQDDNSFDEMVRRLLAHVGALEQRLTNVQSLAELSNNMGDQVAGRFLSPADGSTSLEPTDTGFTGWFAAGNGEVFLINGVPVLFRMGGVTYGVLQVGFTDDGKLIAGAGALTIDVDGLTFEQGTNEQHQVKWKSNGVLVGGIYCWGSGIPTNNMLLYLANPVSGSGCSLELWTVGALNNFYFNNFDVVNFYDAELQRIEEEELNVLGSPPSNPSAGHRKFYAASDGLHDLNSAGVDTLLGAGGGGGSAVINLCINPGFETVLPGTHTNAIKRVNTASTTRNTQFPGWQLVSGTGSPDITVDQETSILSDQSGSALKVTIAGLGTTTNPKIRQLWNSAQYLSRLVYGVRGRYLTFALDVKLGTATASAVRAFIYSNGTGGTTTYSSYHGNNTNWERLLVSVQIPADATEIRFGCEFASATPVYYLDNGMTAASAVALSTLAYEVRNPISVRSDPYNVYASNYDLLYNTPADTNYHETGDGTADVDYSINANPQAWATHVNVFLFGSGTTNGESWRCKVLAGDAGPIVYLAIAGNYGAVSSEMAIGQDGQILFGVSKVDVVGRLNFRRWMGDNL